MLSEVDLQHAFDQFLPEKKPSLFTFVPAGPPTRDPAAIASKPDASRGRAVARELSRQYRRASLITRVPIQIARAFRSTFNELRIGIAGALRSTVLLTIRVALAFRSGAKRFTIGIAGALRSTGQSAIQIARAFRSTFNELRIGIAGALRSTVLLTIRVALAFRSGAERFTIGIAGARRSTGQLAIEMAPAIRSTFNELTIGIGRALRLAAHPAIQLPPAFRSSAQRLAVPALVVACVTAAALAGMVIVKVWPPIADQTLPGAQQSSSATTTTGRSAGPSADGPHPIAERRAIQRVLNRYRDAFSILDTGAVRAVWPAVDARGLAKVFDRLEEQNYEFDSCRISVADLRAEASCQGSAQYTQRGSGRPRNEPRQWRFALRKVNENWLIDAVNSN